MNFKLFVAAISTALLITSCVSKPVDTRVPAGTGDIGSSTEPVTMLESYKLPVTRNSKVATRVAYNFWSGEYPNPVIDVQSDQNGTTTIQGYSNLRNPDPSNKMNCTIKNGIYHPWSKTDDSSINYYTLQAQADFKVINNTSTSVYNAKTKKTDQIKIPQGTEFLNVVYYGENYCGAIYSFGKTKHPFSESCDFFFDNKDVVRTTPNEEFTEQWLYLKCEEKDASGKNQKVFVKDTDLLSQPSITKGCPFKWGKVQGSKNCGSN